IEGREIRALGGLPGVSAGSGEVDVRDVVAGGTLWRGGVREDFARAVADDDLGDVGLVRLDSVHKDHEADGDHLTGVKATRRERVQLGDGSLFSEGGAGERGEREERSDRQGLEASHWVI